MYYHKTYYKRLPCFIIIAAIALTVCCGLGFSLNNELPDKDDSFNFSSNDSIVFDIIEVLREEKNLGEERRREIERKINSFPGKIVRRDTASYFLQSALQIAFHEYVSENYEEATQIAGKFKEDIEEEGIFNNISRYWLIKVTPEILKTKEKYKNLPADSLPAQKPIKFGDTHFEFFRDPKSFAADIFEGLPVDLNLATYKRLLEFYIESGGRPSGLNQFAIPGFYHHCKYGGREDILEEVKKLWNLDDSNFTVEKTYGIYKYIDRSPIDTLFAEANKKILDELAMSMHDEERNIQVIDSLININRQDSIGKYVDNFQRLKYMKGENRAVIEMSVNYEPFIPESWKPRFYNYWGIAHLALEEREEAADKFLLAIKHRTNPEIFSGAVLNYGLALAESGNYEKAMEAYKSQERKAANLSDSVFYWEGLGHIHSLFNKEEASYYFRKVDSLIDASTSPTLKVDDAFLTRHFAREAKLFDHDLFEWREILRKARFYSGVDSYINLYGTPYSILFRSEMGRYRNFLFDFEGAAKDFRAAQRKAEKLDSNDYRVKWWNESWQALHKFNEIYGKDRKSIRNSLACDELSPLHKIWLLGDLVLKILPDTASGRTSDNGLMEDFSSGFLIDNLQSNLAESLLALSSDESKYLLVPVITMQEILMPAGCLQDNPRELARLNLLRKGLLQTSKVALEKELMKGRRKADYEVLKDLRKRLNHAYIYEDSLRIKRLLPQISSRERELYYSMKDSLDFGKVISANPEHICLNLKENDLAIDFIEYNKNDSIITGAFIYLPDGEIRYQELMATYDDKKENIWEKLYPWIKDREDIYFSLDGSLINRGIEYYPDENGDPVFLNHRLHRVAHLRDININDSPIEGEMVLIGVSDHNSPIGEAGQLYRGDWTDLPDVEYEIKLIDSMIYQYPHRLFYNDDAIEENIKDIDGKDISVIHFSTHGVYRSLDSLNYAASHNSHFDHNIALRRLRTDDRDICGIVLRKGNLTWRMPHLLDDEDDILTAEEIEVMNFPNLQLTVLSACDSGLGEINSDGIHGLQRAFKIAGAKNIICSLNKVDDYWSAQFMGELYKNLADGLSIYDSFRKARLSIKLAAPDNPVAWSSYILIE